MDPLARFDLEAREHVNLEAVRGVPELVDPGDVVVLCNGDKFNPPILRRLQVVARSRSAGELVVTSRPGLESRIQRRMDLKVSL